MAGDKKVDELNLASAMQGDELLYAAQGGQDVHVTPDTLAAYIQGQLNVLQMIDDASGIDIESGKLNFPSTVTPGGTTGDQTINAPSGTVNMEPGATVLVVTNSLCRATSIVLPVLRTADSSATIKNVVPADGHFTINFDFAPLAETSIGFLVIN